MDIKLQQRALAVSRRALPSCDWDTIASKIIDDRRDWEAPLRKPAIDVDSSLMGGLAALQKDGFHIFPRKLEAGKVAAIRRYLESQPVYRGSHIYSSDSRLQPLAEVQKDSTYAGYTADQVMRAPYVIDALNDPALIDFMEAALGCVPTLYSVNAWWSLPATVPTGFGMQNFHRDNDDWRFFTLFYYLTDVDAEPGPHQLLPGSHTLAGTEAILASARARGAGAPPFEARQSFLGEAYFSTAFSPYVERNLAPETIDVTGEAGTMFLANTLTIHRGLMPSRKPRLILWARYGLGPNTNSVDLEQGPLGRFQVPTSLTDTPRNRYINRLLFEFDRNASLVCDGTGNPPLPPPVEPPPAPAGTDAPGVVDLTMSPALRTMASARRTGARRAFVRSIGHWLTGWLRR
jgi:hypothetical protein